MPKIVVRSSAVGSAATAITVALILMMASPVILTTTEEAFAASKSSNKDCKDIQFHPIGSPYIDNTITIGTSQHEYSVEIDYREDETTAGLVYEKNVAADDPRGRVLLPEGETITITLQSYEYLPEEYHTAITLYNHKVSDCQILLGQVKAQDKVNLKIVSIEQTRDSPGLKEFAVTVQVPDASEIDEHFTKLGVQFDFAPEALDHYLISHRVHVR